MMGPTVSGLKLEVMDHEKAIDVATECLKQDPKAPFKQVVDAQDLIEQRCLPIWADISFPQGGRLSGYIGFCTLNVCDEFIELYRFFVTPTFRRLGIGRGALSQLAQYISAEGKSEFYIELTSSEAAPFWSAAAQDFSVSEAGHCKWKLSFPKDVAEGIQTR